VYFLTFHLCIRRVFVCVSVCVFVCVITRGEGCFESERSHVMVLINRHARYSERERGSRSQIVPQCKKESQSGKTHTVTFDPKRSKSYFCVLFLQLVCVFNEKHYFEVKGAALNKHCELFRQIW
jgi:hypothetical protein